MANNLPFILSYEINYTSIHLFIAQFKIQKNEKILIAYQQIIK